MVSQVEEGRFRFRVYLPHASRVELVGSFTRWRAGAIPLERQKLGGGWWELVAEIPEGEHEFCYVVDNSVWLADYAANGVTLSGQGGWVSKLKVRPAMDRVAA